MHTKQQHQCSVLLEFINETQPALMIPNPCVYPPDRVLVKTCIITHRINFPALSAFINLFIHLILLGPFHLFVSFLFIFMYVLRRSFVPLFLFHIVISQSLGLDPH